MTELGYEQAIASGKAIQSFLTRDGSGGNDNDKIQVDAVYCSLLRRAKDTMNFALKEMDLLVPFDQVNNNTSRGGRLMNAYKIPVITSWRLNERHYGALVGLSKDGAERLYGKERLTKWRNGWDTAPPKMEIGQLQKWIDLDHTRAATVVTDSYDPNSFYGDNDDGNSDDIKNKREFTIIEKGPFFDNDIDDGENTGLRINVKDLANHQRNNMPASESLFDTCQRILPIFEDGIAPRLRNGQTVVIFAHANTIRSLLYYIDPYVVTKHTLKQVKIPSAIPLLYSFQNCNNVKSAEANGGHDDGFIIPGGLQLIKVNHNDYDNHEIERSNKPQSGSVRLSGEWLQNKEVKKLSFCSEIGQQNLEHEIA